MAAGFSEAKSIGFASYDQPSYSLFSGAKPQERSQKERPDKGTNRAKRFDAPKKGEPYPWPSMAVARKLDAPEAGRRWRSYYEKTEMHARRIGRAVGFRNIRCELIGQTELHNALIERYPDVAHDPNEHRRNQTVRKFTTQLNAILELLQRDSFDTPTEELWSPLIYEVGEQEGVGPNGIGITLLDSSHSYARASRLLVERVATDMQLNPVHFNPQTEPRVLLIDTHPLPVEGLHFSLPKDMPIDMPFKAPRAYTPL